MSYRGLKVAGFTDAVNQTAYSYWYDTNGRLKAARAQPSGTSPLAQNSLVCLSFNVSKTFAQGPSFGNIELVRDGAATPVTQTIFSRADWSYQDPYVVFDAEIPRMNPPAWLSPEQASEILLIAAALAELNIPYSLLDCSHAVWSVYMGALLGYVYVNSYGFLADPPPQFEAVSIRQPGDIAVWPGHMAIFDPNAGTNRDAWSASNPLSLRPFGPAEIRWFTQYYGQDPVYYRYINFGR